MTAGLEFPVNIWAWPGPRATAGVAVTDTGQRVLSVFLDPANLTVMLPPVPDAEHGAARFFHLLARACTQLSADYSGSDPRSPSLPGAHRARPEYRGAE